MYEQNSGKDIAIPAFYRKAFLNERKTKREGAPVYQEIEMVNIIIPGSRDVVERPVEEADKARWPTQYQAFLLNQEQPTTGIPIEEFATATESERAMMRGAKIRTVEQMANFPDGNLSKVGIGAVRLRDKARLYLDRMEKISQTTQLMNEIDALKAQIEELKNGNTVKPVPERTEGDRVSGPNVDHLELKSRRKETVRADTGGGGFPGEAA